VQLALAWLLARGEDVVPIPGTKRVPYLEENVAAVDVTLTDQQLTVLEETVPAPAGDRYDEDGMRSLNR
jgi:aryl-alcohol dehydrogenase-like predicted oxidoreductase